MTPYEWTAKKDKAAIALSEGQTINEAAAAAGVSEKTVDRWKRDIEFTREVDRLTMMIGIASRAERIRIAKKVIRKKLDTDGLSEKDLLDWLKFAQSETDGVKLDLTSILAALTANETPVAGGGSGGTGGPTEGEDGKAI